MALDIASLPIAVDNNTFQVQLVVTRNILFLVVLGINFLQTHGGIISFPTNQLYLPTSSPTPADQLINANHIHHAFTPLIHATAPYHSHPYITVPPTHPYHVINTAPVIIPARANTIMTNPCTLPHSGNSLFELLKQHFDDQPVESTPVIINAEDDNLPVHFINHSDRDVVEPKHIYVEAMEKVQESDRDNLSTNATPEPVSQHALSECLAHNDQLPSQRRSMYTSLQENSGVFGSSIAALSSTPLVQHSTDTSNAKPIKQDLNFLKLTKSKVDLDRNLTWKQLLTYGTTVRLKIRLQAARPERTGQLYFLDWTLPPVLTKRLHISNHLALGVYNPLSPKNTSLIQTVTHTCCHLAMNASEHPRTPQNPNTIP